MTVGVRDLDRKKQLHDLKLVADLKVTDEKNYPLWTSCLSVDYSETTIVISP